MFFHFFTSKINFYVRIITKKGAPMGNGIMEVAAFGILGWFMLQVLYFQKIAMSDD